MKTIICGSGDVGYSIANKLSKENFEVTVVDETSDKLTKISENLDVKVISGLPSLPSVLMKAGAKDCEILIAVTKSDETNMIACQIGHSLFDIPKKIARIRQQDYLQGEWQNLYTKNNLPIDAIISPEQEVAQALHRRIISPGTIDMVELSEKKLKLIGFKCESNCNHLGLTVRELSAKFPDYLANILFIFRGDKKFVVNSTTKIQSNDLIYMVVETENLSDVLEEFGHKEIQAKKIVIIGGGNIGFSLAELIEKSNTDISTELIEFDKTRAEFLASNLQQVTVTNGDGLDNQILEEVNISEAGYCVAVTEDDEVNVLSSLLAKRAGADQSMAIINNSSYTSLLSNIGIDITIDPKIITISKILEKVRGGRIRSDYSIGDGFGEVIEAEIQSKSPICNKNLNEIDLPKGIRIGSIFRNEKIIIPNSKTIFHENDDIVFFAETKCIKKLEELLSIE
ncbi:MAG: Trk system potassium uptake protein TrkA [Alphaproteobacteria bacterium MarineAlpha5_Bin5]|nr:MAG: Trk system potassium uptake protein TrkA [Alphaproteobacteria bacterium MarineAlpha5_Bin5]PPR49406.1 MAG: Trk system potassium uptake protein TrkA [Alphaproteobacteria bacterium MarineAlpha5_Bin4]|tara:strand:- start:5470 stop:6834 length:1365 start_codon:yes stop_codon:yes gene_type:complete